MRRAYQRRSRGPVQIETEGRTLEEAVQSAMRRLHVKREDLEYEVIEAARGGFLGLGARPARIKARARSGGGTGPGRGGPQVRVPGTTGAGRGEGRGNGGESRRRAEPRDDRREIRRDDGSPDARRTGRHRSDRRRSSEGRQMDEPGRGAVKPSESRPHTEDATGPRSPRRGRGAEQRRPGRTEPVTPPTEQAINAVREFTKELLARMGHPSEVSVSWVDDAYNVQVTSDRNDQALIGDGGETMDALQHIVAKMSSRGLERLNLVRMNIGGFRERREDELTSLALKYSQSVKETGEELVTEPLRAAERRIIHRTLMDDPEVKTHALGNGLVKRVWIGPAGAEIGSDDTGLPTGSDVEQVEVREDKSSPETVSMVDDWDKPADNNSTDEAPEWGRRRKPARGRRR